MKKLTSLKRASALIIAVLLLLLCCACGAESSKSEPTPEPAPEPTPTPAPTPTPEPESTPGTVRLLKLPVVWTTLNRGDEVDVVGEEDGYYVVELDGRKQYIDNRLIRLDKDTAFETNGSKTVYATSKAFIYETALLNGEAIANPAMNEELLLLDELKGVSYVDYQGIKGYIASDFLSETEISLYQYWGGDSGGGGAPAGGGGGGGADGGDIALGYYVHPRDEHILVQLSNKTDSQKGLVFSDKTEVYVSFLKKGDTVKVIDRQDDYAAILFEDSILVVPGYSIRLKTDEPFTQWEGFTTKSGSILFKDYNMNEELKTLAINTKLSVVDEFENCYLVETDDGTGYMEKDSVSDTETIVYLDGGYSDGGGSSGGGAEWTEPVL